MIKAEYKLNGVTVAWVKFDENSDFAKTIEENAPAKWDECVWDRGYVKPTLKDIRKKIKNKSVSKKLADEFEELNLDTDEDNPIEE